MTENTETSKLAGAAVDASCQDGTATGLADAVVQARGITREYGQGDACVYALAGVDLDLQRGA